MLRPWSHVLERFGCCLELVASLKPLLASKTFSDDASYRASWGVGDSSSGLKAFSPDHIGFLTTVSEKRASQRYAMTNFAFPSRLWTRREGPVMRPERSLQAKAKVKCGVIPLLSFRPTTATPLLLVFQSHLDAPESMPSYRVPIVGPRPCPWAGAGACKRLVSNQISSSLESVEKQEQPRGGSAQP